MNPDARFLPPGYPLPESEVIAQLRQNILQRLAPPHPPETAELAVLILADEAGLELGEVDAEAVWALPPADREGLFLALRRALAEA